MAALPAPALDPDAARRLAAVEAEAGRHAAGLAELRVGLSRRRESSAILLTPPSPSVLKRLPNAEGACSRMTVSAAGSGGAAGGAGNGRAAGARAVHRGFGRARARRDGGHRAGPAGGEPHGLPLRSLCRIPSV